MTRIPPPLLGYNNNVRYLGRTFHIQTEDSGTKYARIMTHLFIDGGHIVKTTRTEYGAVLEQPNMAETVRRMMKDQHKNMFLSLRAGEFDILIDRVLNAESPASVADPGLSRIPRLRADSLPSLSFGAGDEAKTMPGTSTFVIEGSRAPAAIEARVTPTTHAFSPDVPLPNAEPSALGLGVAAVANDEHETATEAQAEPVSAAGTLGQTSGAPRRTATRPRKTKSGAPAATRRASLEDDDPTATRATETEVTGSVGRPSERSSRKIPIRPLTATKETIDPRSQSIFGDATAGRQSLDEVILSFLEDEET